ncbi:MAG: preprotein translocase subunit SecA [Candidatus Omnitrophica bacterium]|nr:preprotein translocase subunit SecA [Candidatus Omnitrophota bacterium]
MINWITSKIMGSRNEREVKKLKPLLDKVNAFEAQVSKLTDEQLRAKTAIFKKRLGEKRESIKEKEEHILDAIYNATSQAEKDRLKLNLKALRNGLFEEILPEAFAVVRETAKRTINMRHFDSQIIGGLVLHQGKIAEMATGEGKTLVATLPVYLNALMEYGAHVITVNDYLAKRDTEWMGPVFRFLGLSVGTIVHDMSPEKRRAAYACDITYGTNNEFGFDYLRDNMVIDKNDMVQRGHFFAVVDEVDSILIDEARTPLIISGPSEESTDKYYKIDKIIPRLKKGSRNEQTKEETGDYIVDEKAHTVYLTEEGEKKATALIGIQDLHSFESMEYKHHVIQALKAHNLFQIDVDYLVKDAQVIIVDEFTGRLMPGRRWSDGLHQAIEAKEGVKIERENQTLATITFQNYFRMYDKLSGMTGTAATEADEFDKIYKLDVITIPTNKVLIRKEHPDVIYKTQKEKFNAIVSEIEALYKQKRPVLVGTISIEKSEVLSELLKRKQVPHNVLNAKYHEYEAHIVAQAGKSGAITIATNMAGRGTDILLGGNPEFKAKDTIMKLEAGDKALSEEEKIQTFKEAKEDAAADHGKVVSIGGLHIIGTERHEARRIDNQLRGRSGRQGDPGSSRFYVSLEDDLMRIFGSDRVAKIVNFFKLEEGTPIAEHAIVAKSIETAQRRVEMHNFEIRKHVLEYDNVMNKQREVIYDERKTILESENLKDYILDMSEELLDAALAMYCRNEKISEEWDMGGLSGYLKVKFALAVNSGELSKFYPEELKEFLFNGVKTHYEAKTTRIGAEMMNALTRFVMLQSIDSKWKEHLRNMDELREGIGLRAYGQRDPVIEYQKEGYEMFTSMMESIKNEAIEFIFKLEPATKTTGSVFSQIPQEAIHPEAQAMNNMRLQRERAPAHAPQEGPSQPTKRSVPKVGRNDPCPCGSGKKYKKCCGANE